MDVPVQYKIDTQKSLFTVHPFATGMAATLSHGLTISIRDFSGVMSFIPGTLEHGSMNLRIKSDSLMVTDQMKANDRREIEQTMREQVLRVSEHPEIVFKSSSIVPTKLTGSLYKVDVTGNLTITGVTRPHSFVAQVAVISETLRANGDFKAKQTDFHIPLVTAGGGLIKLHDELKFHFYIVAEKQA